MITYNPRPLGEEALPQVVAIGPRIEDRKLVLVIGAGVSIGMPTCLPSGVELARNVKARLLTSPLAAIIQPVANDDLLAMADAVDTQLPETFPAFVRAILETADFRAAMPNYAHLAIALLMAETNVPVLSTNWDTCIERASQPTASFIVACTCRDNILNAGNSILLLKLHGCATNESSIRISSRQIAEETWWAINQVGAAIETGFVAFLGIGSIAPYIKTSVQKILGMSKQLSNILIIDPLLSKEWGPLLTDPKKQNIAISSEEFLDDILRTLTLSQLSRANALAQEVAEGAHTGIDVKEATRLVIDFFRKYPAHFIWLWVRRGFFSTGPNQSIMDPTFKQFVLGLALINSVSPFSNFVAVADTVYMRSEQFVIEIAWARDPISAKTLYLKKSSSLSTDKKRNALPQDKPFVVVAYGAVGGPPASIMKDSIVEERHPADIIDGSDTLDIRWVNLGDLIQNWEKAKICQMVGVGVND